MSLRTRLHLVERPVDLLNEWSIAHHYMRRPINSRACPFGWSVRFDGRDLMDDGKPCGFIMFSTLQYTRLKGEFGYPGLPTQWQVLHLARLWLHDALPFNSETCVMGMAHRAVQRRWLEVHPPRFPDEPYHIVKIISYADLKHHVGTVYRAANYRCLGDRLVRASNAKPDGEPSAQLALWDAAPDGEHVAEDRMLRCFVLDLPAPRWTWEPPVSAQMRLFEEIATNG